MRAWLIGGDGAVVARREGVGFAGLAGGETGVVDVRLELGPGGVLGYRWGNECNTTGAEGGEGWVDGETQGYQGRNDGRDAGRVFRKTRSKKSRGETGSRGAGACEASWSHASWVPATSPSARAIVLITTRLKCSLHHAQAARVKGLIKRPPAACICPLFSRCPRYCPPSWRCDRHEHPDLPSQAMSCGR
jgi:hypothetical protein